MNDEIDGPLPDLADAVLDPATLDQLFFDVAAETELVMVLVKEGAMDHASASGLSLADARRALVEEGKPFVQLRYRYRGSEWWDTLMRVQGGVRLVRIEHRFRSS